MTAEEVMVGGEGVGEVLLEILGGSLGECGFKER
jgi:hypothetical protein